MKNKYIECSCGHNSHTLRFTMDPNDPTNIYVGYYLYNFDNVFQRIWTAIKYVFRVEEKFGHFDETLLNPEQIDELINFTKKFKKLNAVLQENQISELTDDQANKILDE